MLAELLLSNMSPYKPFLTYISLISTFSKLEDGYNTGR